VQATVAKTPLQYTTCHVGHPLLACESPYMPESIPLREKHKPQNHRANAPAPSLDSSLEGNGNAKFKEPDSPAPSDLDFDDWDEHDASMPSDLRRSHDANGHTAPLLGGRGKDEDEGMEDGVGGLGHSTHHFHERDPETQAKFETRKRYTYAAITLALSLVSFTVQTETAVYIQHQLKWEKPYCMLYVLTTPPPHKTSLTNTYDVAT